MDEKERIKYCKDLRKREFNEWFPFESIENKITLLHDFARVIDNHPEELHATYQKIIKERKIRPSEPLVDYFILEINRFYEVALKKFKDLKPPDTRECVRKLRNKIIAHLDKEYQTPDSIVGIYDEAQEFGFDKIYEDFVDFKETVKKRVQLDSVEKVPPL